MPFAFVSLFLRKIKKWGADDCETGSPNGGFSIQFLLDCSVSSQWQSEPQLPHEPLHFPELQEELSGQPMHFLPLFFALMI